MQSALERFLQKAKTRHVTNLALAELAAAASLAMCGAILLLLLGTQILEWYWPLILLALGLGLAGWRIPRKIPSGYKLAQQVDSRLGLHDSLPTAYHFSRTESVRGSLVSYQLEEANRLAESADVKHAVPLVFPRSLYMLGALVAVAGTLFAVRYGLTRQIALANPIAQWRFNPFRKPSPRVQAETRKSVIQEKLEQQMQQLGIASEEMNPLASNDPLAMKGASALATPDGQEPMSSPEKGQAAGKKPSKDSSEEGEGGEGSESASSGAGSQPGDEQAASNMPQGSQGKPQNGAQNGKQGTNQGNDSSLANKMRDAVANLLSKLKSNKSEGQQQQMASSQQGNAGGKQQQASQKGMQGQGKSNAEGQGNQDQQGNQDGDAGERAAAQNKGDKNAEKPGNQDSKSGIGRSDGAKDVREAEQLAAMGKISEILGKRSAQVAGEMSVEVASGKQQLRTAYTQKKAQHADLGSEVDRDEVPLIYQPYVQRYFEEVRKTQGTKAQPKPAKGHVPEPTVQAEPGGK